MTVEPMCRDETTTAPPPAPALPEVTLRGVRIHALSEAALIEHVTSSLAAGRGGWIVTLNLQHMHRCDTDPSYRELVADADVVVADGMPLVWAARLQGTPLPERVAGSDLVSTLSAAAGRAGRSVFLLGGNPGAAEGAAQALQDRCPGLRVAGIEVPVQGFEREPGAIAALRDAPPRRTSCTSPSARPSRSGSSASCAARARRRGGSAWASASAS
jgi:N-acetylglucosaminyldiphosphoundecaprenol N-acetyl-beta-D-mannosaminyltransferase